MCDARWLVAVCLKDIEHNYLLAANVGGRMPWHLQMECGLDSAAAELSSLEESDTSRITRKKGSTTGRKQGEEVEVGFE